MYVPLILYSPLSWLFELRTLRAEEALEPTVSTRSNPGGPLVMLVGCRFSSPTAAAPGRRAKGLRMGMLIATDARIDTELACQSSDGGTSLRSRKGNCCPSGWSSRELRRVAWDAAGREPLRVTGCLCV